MIAQERQQAQQRAAQADARTHDFAAVHYELTDGSYTFTRAQMEAVLGVPPSELRDGAAMHDQVQARLEDTEFVASFYVQTQCRHSSRTQ